MTFVESIKTCLVQKYFSIQGRASRSEYWWFILLCYILNFIGNFIPLIGIVIALGLIVPSITVCIRRCHDLGRSGKILFAPALVFLVGTLIMILGIYLQSTGLLYFGIFVVSIGGLGTIALNIYFIFPGTQGPNKYGEKPYEFVDNKAAVNA